MLSNKKKYEAVIFDLDGTLIDSLHDIADSMNRVLAAHGYPIHEYNAYRYFVGKGLKNLAENVLPEKERQTETIQSVFKDLMTEYGNNVVRKTILYNGIPELLDELSKRGIKLAVLSNKAHELTTSISEKILNKWYFDVILGSRADIPRKPDPTGAYICIKELGLNRQNILYIGDSGVDMQTAINANLTSVGVTWGFRTRKELLENGAVHIIDQPSELLDLL